MTPNQQVLSDEQIEGLSQAMIGEFEDQPDFWPIAKLVVKDAKIESASFFAPGLPDGEHEVYPAPTHLDEHTAAWFAVHGALERHVPEMLKFGGTGIQCAVNAIEYLASKALTPMQPPISEANIERLFRTVKAWPLAENCTRDEWFWFANGAEQGARAIESAALAALAQQARGGWVGVDVRLPEKYSDVIIKLKNGSRRVGRVNHAGFLELASYQSCKHQYMAEPEFWFDDTLAQQAQEPVGRRCSSCGTHEVAIKLECQNSNCSAYADSVTIHEGWRTTPPAPQVPAPVVSEDDLVACLISSGCVGTVKMSFESGPMSITRPSLNATKFARAILALRPAVEPMTDEVRRSYQCLLAMNTPHGFGDRIGPFVKWLQDSGITAKAEGGV